MASSMCSGDAMEDEIARWTLEISSFCLSGRAFDEWVRAFQIGGVVARALAPDGEVWIVGKTIWLYVHGMEKYCVAFTPPSIFGEA